MLAKGTGHCASTGFQLIAPSFPLSIESSLVISSSDNEKLNTSAFDRTRSGSDDFGSGTKLVKIIDYQYLTMLCGSNRESRTLSEATNGRVPAQVSYLTKPKG